MDYKRACAVLGIIILLSISIIFINSTKEKVVHEKQIESKLSLSITDEDKRTVNYRKLVADIRSIEDNGQIKYAKQSSNKSDIGTIVYGNVYQGDGYSIVIEYAEDATIYQFIVNQKSVYSAGKSEWFDSNDVKAYTQKRIRTIIVWVIIGAMSIAELVLFIKYRGVNKAQKDVEDKKMVWYNYHMRKKKEERTSGFS